MTVAGFSFISWRLAELITLIPTLGMLAWFVDWYNDRNLLTPTSILVLFIVSVLGAAWALGTLFLYSRARHSAGFVAFVDLLFVGAFIGAVYALRGIAHADCSNWTRDSDAYSADLGLVQITADKIGLNVNRECAMLKASFAFGIMNCIFFFLTFLFSLLLHRHYDSRDRVVVKRDTHYSRHSGRRSSHQSRSPRRSHHSHHSRRSYV